MTNQSEYVICFNRFDVPPVDEFDEETTTTKFVATFPPVQEKNILEETVS